MASILILAGLIALTSLGWSGNLKRFSKAKRIEKVTLLLERKISELETEFKNENILSLPEKDEGEFEDEKNYIWSYTTQPFQLPNGLTLLNIQGLPQSNEHIFIANQMKKILSETVVELKLTVSYLVGKKSAKYSLSTYFVNYLGASSQIQSAVSQFALPQGEAQ